MNTLYVLYTYVFPVTNTNIFLMIQKEQLEIIGELSFNRSESTSVILNKGWQYLLKPCTLNQQYTCTVFSTKACSTFQKPVQSTSSTLVSDVIKKGYQYLLQTCKINFMQRVILNKGWQYLLPEDLTGAAGFLERQR